MQTVMSAGLPAIAALMSLAYVFGSDSGIFADIGDLPPQFRIAKISEIDLVDLQVAAASIRKIADFLAIDRARDRRRMRPSADRLWRRWHRGRRENARWSATEW
jgi:hypothetical protein